MFLSNKTLEYNFANGLVLENSAFLEPPLLNEPSNKQHKVFFDTVPTAYVCSEPIRIEGVSSFDKLFRLLGEAKMDTGEFLAATQNWLLEQIEPSGEIWERYQRDLDKLNLLPENNFRADLKRLWRFSWIKDVLAVHYGVAFHLI